MPKTLDITVPIVGALQVTGWLLTVQVVCPCATKPVLLAAGQVGMVFGCKACGQAYRVAGFKADEGQLYINIDKVVVQRPDVH
jgi:hypothetical protein